MKFTASILGIAIALLAAACSDVLSVHYDNIEAARADGAFERGWLPGWLPEWAEDIHETHDLDTNASAFSFYMPPGSDDSFRESCSAGITASDPEIRVKNMPKNISMNSSVIACGDFFVYKPEGRIIYAWKN